MLDQNNAGFENKLLAKIKDSKMSPKPRWRFLLTDSFVWFAGLIALLIGAAAISVMIYLFKFNDWEIYDQTKKSFLEFFILTLPYFWIVFLALFVFILSYYLKHTKKGYRYSEILIIGASIILSVILGTVLYATGCGEKLDNIIGSRTPYYDQVINRHVDMWSQPHEGRLSGLVVDKSSDEQFILVDRENQAWIVNTENSKLYGGAVVIIYQPIRLTGKETGEHTFRADRILPLNAGRGFFLRLNIPDSTQ